METGLVGRRVRTEGGRRGTVVDARLEGREARVAWDEGEPTWEDVELMRVVGAEAGAIQ